MAVVKTIVTNQPKRNNNANVWKTLNQFPKNETFKKLAHMHYIKCLLWRNLCLIWKKNNNTA